MTQLENLRVIAPPVNRQEELLTAPAQNFLLLLHQEFNSRREDLLKARAVRRTAVRSGQGLDFLEETRAIREDSSWRVAPAAPGLQRRNVEITGPPTPTMTVNALNSGADVWMADFEDSTTPTWQNLIEGQLSVLDALDGTLEFTTANGKHYSVAADPATIVVRPRGWHMTENHILIDGKAMSGSLFDFGLHFFHGASLQASLGHAPGFYLPKLESHLEARLWNDVFNFAQDHLGIARGTIRATVLIETIPAAFEMDEILYELKEHAAGLNAGRWDYIFSMIKYFGADPDFILPDRALIKMTTPFMRAYAELLVATCHKRGAHAIGGMAAAVPVKANPEQFERAMADVRVDKRREATDGFDGSWIAHPACVPVCREAFDDVLQGSPDQKSVLRADVCVSASDLLATQLTQGEVTEAGVRGNIATSLRYLAAWLDGHGAVALNGLMEDAATVEIARSQLWQWREVNVRLSDGRALSEELLGMLLDNEVELFAQDPNGTSQLSKGRAADLIRSLLFTSPMEEFITTIAYNQWIAPPR